MNVQRCFEDMKDDANLGADIFLATGEDGSGMALQVGKDNIVVVHGGTGGITLDLQEIVALRNYLVRMTA